MSNPALPQIDLRRCTQCALCARACPEQVLEMAEGLPLLIRPQACTFCAICEAACPAGAIRCEFTIRWASDLP